MIYESDKFDTENVDHWSLLKDLMSRFKSAGGGILRRVSLVVTFPCLLKYISIDVFRFLLFGPTVFGKKLGGLALGCNLSISIRLFMPINP